MLALSRTIGESIKIGDNITIVIAEVRGNQVRLAIDAPREITVHRAEVYERIQKERKTAA